jgi:hypothetical protein
MPRIIIIEPNISQEEKERNFKKAIEVLERIAQEMSEAE